MNRLKLSLIQSMASVVEFRPEQFEIPPSQELGDLALPLHATAKNLGVKPDELSFKLAEMLNAQKAGFVSEAKSMRGYLNFFLNTQSVADLTWRAISALGAQYGVDATSKESVIVEHTSANPIHPLHIGAARNALFGDTLARLLRAQGKKVETHFYVDDTGRQTALAALAYKLLGQPSPKGKPDSWVGLLYVFGNAFMELFLAKEALKEAKSDDDVRCIQQTIDEWVGVLSEQSQKQPEMFEALSEAFSNLRDPRVELSELILRYEEGEPSTRLLVRNLVQHCLSGFVETLRRANIAHDKFDYESDLLWNGSVNKVLSLLASSVYVERQGLAMTFDVNRAAEQLGLKQRLGIQRNHVLPKLVLTRSDGTTLYTTRDLAYSLEKLSKSDRVYNIIGAEQSLKQLQLKVVLYSLGYTKVLNQIHVPYEYVDLPDGSMSGRRGRYITFDSIMDEAKMRATPEVEKRNPGLPKETISELSEKIAAAAIRFALIGVNANKKIVFTWDRVLNFETNSGPYALYTYARANSILAKSNLNLDELSPDFSKLSNTEEHRLVVLAARLPESVAYAANSLRPEVLPEYVLRVCDIFNSYYASTPVLGAGDLGTREARIALVKMIQQTLSSAFAFMGITPPIRM